MSLAGAIPAALSSLVGPACPGTGGVPHNVSTPLWLVHCPLGCELQLDSPGGALCPQGGLPLGPPLGTAGSPEGSEGAEGMRTRPAGKWGLQRRATRPGRAVVGNGGAPGWAHSAGTTVITGAHDTCGHRCSRRPSTGGAAGRRLAAGARGSAAEGRGPAVGGA